MKFTRNHIKEAIHIAKNRKTMTAMVKDAWKGKFKMTLYTYILAILAVVYTISPVDFLPDVIPVIGWVDDGVLLFLLFQQLRKELTRYQQKEITVDVEPVILK